jgi:hypothetical protein
MNSESGGLILVFGKFRLSIQLDPLGPFLKVRQGQAPGTARQGLLLIV